MNPNLLTIDDLCAELGIGKNKAYALVKSKEIPSGKIGSRIMIHRTELDKYIETRTKHT